MILKLNQCGLMQARADVDAKRTKLAKLRGTAGIKVRLVLHQPCCTQLHN